MEPTFTVEEAPEPQPATSMIPPIPTAEKKEENDDEEAKEENEEVKEEPTALDRLRSWLMRKTEDVLREE